MLTRVAVAFPFAASLLCGCGGGYRFDVAPVRGTVTCDGEPLTSGTIVFTPIAEQGAGMAGKPAMGAIRPDGSFVLSTYEPEDGAVIGKHSVSYMPPGEGEEGEEDEEEGETPSAPAAPPKKTAGRQPCRFGGTAAAPAEVVAGENDVTVELSAMGPEGE